MHGSHSAKDVMQVCTGRIGKWRMKMTQYIYGTNYADYQYGVSWDYNVIYGYEGNDVQYGNQYADSIFGHGGNDYQYGFGGNDYLDGGAGNDVQYGYDGNDSLYGGYGNDYQYGMAGNDYLNGQYGTDHLWGGAGSDSLIGGYDYNTDYFHFNQGDSDSSTAGADHIYDWNVSYDYIDSSIAGTSSNYAEAQTWWTTVEGAEYHVENTNLRYEDHVFLYNVGTDTGYLLSDLDRNFDFETAVVIHGAGSAADMNWSDII
jgi:Ca2+-binding RTX toxin-like protein